MSSEDESRRWWDDRRRKQLDAAAAMSAEHFAQSDAIPDLDFAPPDCPICLENTSFDDGQFICDVCRVVWPSNGYGHEATREMDSDR